MEIPLRVINQGYSLLWYAKLTYYYYYGFDIVLNGVYTIHQRGKAETIYGTFTRLTLYFNYILCGRNKFLIIF